jgi:hypothetical protein
MDDDSFDFAVSDYTTEWSKLAGKIQNQTKKTTYSRRGSVNNECSDGYRRYFSRRKSSPSNDPERNIMCTLSATLSIPEVRIDEEQVWGRRLSGVSNSSRNSPNDSIEVDTFSPTLPVIPLRRKVFRRANSVSDVDQVPKPPPILKRSQSVNEAPFSISSRASIGATERGALENLNPNFDLLEDIASTKRAYSCNIDKSKRKKSRSFRDNEFISLNEASSSSFFAHDPNEFDRHTASTTLRSAKKNHRVLQRGRSLPVFPSPWCGADEDVEIEDVISEHTASDLMLPRKRRPPGLHMEEFGASPPPRQLTAKSRTTSPGLFESPSAFPTPLNEFQERYSFQAVFSSDDDDALSDSDVSTDVECSPDPRLAPTDNRGTERKILQPENATVEDVLETMTSEEDLRYLVRAMTKERNHPSCSKKLWQVALASSWTSDRRDAILFWATENLGFKYTCAGGGVYIMQILSVKGAPLLILFQKAIEAWDTERSGKCKSKPQATIPIEFVVSSPRTKSWKTSQRPSVVKTEHSATS